MKRLFGVVTLAVAVSFLSTTQASAQASIFGGGALTIPTGDFSDFGDNDGAKTGWMGFAGVLFPVGEDGLGLGAEAFFGNNGHEADGESTDVSGLFGVVTYSLHDPEEAGVTLFGGAGLLRHGFKQEGEDTETDSGLGAGFGAALDIPLGSVGGFLAGSYNMGFGDVDGTTFIAISAGLMIPVGAG